MTAYDLVIIGGGASAFAAAIRADELGARTALLNAGLPLGGTCVNVGCVPSKRLLWAAEVLHAAGSHGIPGVDLSVRHLAFADVVKDELTLVDELRAEKYESVLERLRHVTFIGGIARFRGPNVVEVNGEAIRAEKVLLAPGSSATVPDIPGICDAGFLTHVEALRLTRLPRELVVVGGGPVGLEFAQLFSRFGSTVTLLQRNARIFPRGEQPLTDRLRQCLEREGIRLVTGAAVERVERRGGKKVVTYGAGAATQEVAADELLIAVGKRPNTGKLNLELAGVKTNARGAVLVSETYRTSAPNVYAAGDAVELPLRQETTAGREGTMAASNALEGTRHAIDYSAVPYTVFTDPQLAGVGLTEAEQMARFKVCACRTVAFDQVPKARIIGRSEGLIKMVVHPETKAITGVHILAPNAGELIAEAMVLVQYGHTIDDVLATVPMFPTLSEAIRLAALSFTKDVTKLSCCT